MTKMEYGKASPIRNPTARTNIIKYRKREHANAKLAKLLSNGTMTSYHFWHGIASRYPLCCIDYFVFVWNRGLDKKLIKDLKQNGYDFDILEINIGRVMCPDCISKHLNYKKGIA